MGYFDTVDESIQRYLDSWVQHRIDYELQAKNKAKLTNGHWRKLRNYHLEKYLKQIDNPFGFMFHLRYRHKNIYKQVALANHLYVVSLKERESFFK